MAKEYTTAQKLAKPVVCLECGKRHTIKSAKRIMYGTGRCSCGGGGDFDID